MFYRYAGECHLRCEGHGVFQLAAYFDSNPILMMQIAAEQTHRLPLPWCHEAPARRISVVQGRPHKFSSVTKKELFKELVKSSRHGLLTSKVK